MTAFGYDFNFVGPWWHSYETGGIDGGLEYYQALDSGNGHFAYLYHFQDLWLIALDFPVDWPDSSYEVLKCSGLFTLTSYPVRTWGTNVPHFQNSSKQLFHCAKFRTLILRLWRERSCVRIPYQLLFIFQLENIFRSNLNFSTSYRRSTD